MPGAIYEPFDVVVVPYPLTAKPAAARAGAARTAGERRPALVVSSPGFNDRHDQVILAMIIAATAPGWPSDAVLRDWRGAGLPTACKVRARLFTVDRGVILRRLGALGPGDRRVAGGLLSGSFAFV